MIDLRKYIGILSFCLLSASTWAQNGISFFEGTWEEALALAKKQGKLVFVDAYAVWCGPCKMMARDVFTQDSVGAFYNKHFINMKIDMEKGNGPFLSQKYSVTAYPTFLFVDDKGELVHQGRGSQPADAFIDLGRKALSANDRSAEMTERYEHGERNPDFLRGYARALMQAGQPYQKIANEFLRSKPDFSKDENLRFLHDALSESDSYLFEVLLEHQTAVAKLQGDSSLQDGIRQACEVTTKKAVTFQNPSLLQEAKKQYKKAYPKDAANYATHLDAVYAFGISDWDAWAKHSDKWLKKNAATQAKPWAEHALLAVRHCETNKKVLKKALSWIEKSLEFDKNKQYYILYADLLYKNGQVDKSKEIQNKANDM